MKDHTAQTADIAGVEKWANEDLIEKNTAATFKIPSDIKSGTYVLRTALLALHGNSFSSQPTLGSGPQWYTHCFNVEVTGGGNAAPSNTVKFPGGYKREDPGVAFNLRNMGTYDNYVSYRIKDRSARVCWLIYHHRSFPVRPCIRVNTMRQLVQPLRLTLRTPVPSPRPFR